MQLREKIHKPARYREEEIEDLPPKPLFIFESIPFDPNLRPACFPTLPLDQFPPGDSEIAKPAPTTPVTPAMVFRDPRVKRDKEGKMADHPGEYDGFGIPWEDEQGNEVERTPLPVSINFRTYSNIVAN